MGNALTDTGSQVLLVTETGLTRGSKIKKRVLRIHGITGNVMQTNGQIDLCIGKSLLMNLCWGIYLQTDIL
jgi:hypothetical protein